MFWIQNVSLENFRCFENLDLSLERDITVIFAENGEGKSALLNLLAIGLALFKPRSPKNLRLDAVWDARKIITGANDQREPVGPCKASWRANLGTARSVIWSSLANPSSNRTANQLTMVRDAIEELLTPGVRWPLMAWYGTDRMTWGNPKNKPPRETQDRWDGYLHSLDPDTTDAPLLDWLSTEFLGDVVRYRRGEPERRFEKAVFDTMVCATPGVAEIWYDPIEGGPMIRFDNGHLASWGELSDGFHGFLSLIGDIARRAIMLNENDGANAPKLIEGLVLIDEIDLHLHPRWQRIVLDGLRAAFPKLQFVVTTHSPQVLSSSLNRQVRWLIDGKIEARDVFVEGRDSNAILRDLMGTSDRDEVGEKWIQTFYDALDEGNLDKAKELLGHLQKAWGNRDPEYMRAEAFLHEE